MADDIPYNTRIYTDIQGLKKLEYAKDNNAAKKEVAQQFEALMMQMVLRSMRDATKAMSSGLFSNSQMDLYQDMFDKQLSLLMSDSKIGLASMIEKSIDQMQQPQPDDAPHPVNVSLNEQKSPPLVREPHDDQVLEMQARIHPDGKTDAPVLSPSETEGFATPEEFVKKLWSTAKKAASFIGTAPEILLAQAALETNWGKSILPSQATQASSKNLFNIKADANWQKPTTTVDTLEQKNGVLVKERAKFKSYHSYQESFMDYVDLVKNNGRYHEAVNKAGNPEQYIEALHEAGYATDQKYAEKVLKIFSSTSFQSLINKAKNP